MTIENHIKRIKEKYANDINMQLAKLWSLGLQLGLDYGAKQIIKTEIDNLYAKGAKMPIPSWATKKDNRRVHDSMSIPDLEEIVHTTIDYIKKKYPNEHNSQDRWMTLVVEEVGELARAINDGDINNYVEELTQIIAALYLMGIDFCTRENCSVASEDIYTEDLDKIN